MEEVREYKIMPTPGIDKYHGESPLYFKNSHKQFLPKYVNIEKDITYYSEDAKHWYSSTIFVNSKELVYYCDNPK